MIQTRKVQYNCMSKLTPQEMVTRGSQFLAEGDKRKALASGGSSHDTSPTSPLSPTSSKSHSLINPYHNGNPSGVCVCVCVRV